MFNLFRKWKSVRQTSIHTLEGEIYYSPDTKIFIEDGAEIHVYGKVTIGYPLPGLRPCPSFRESIISLKKGSKLIFKGNTHISSGVGIYLDEEAVLEFNGNNCVAHNSIILCKNHISYGLNSSSSWGLNMIDDDGHRFHTPEGEPIKRELKPLIIGNNVAIQINVTIPKAIQIGDGAIIGANTTLRSDIPSNVRAYGKQQIDIKENTTYGFQFNPNKIQK